MRLHDLDLNLLRVLSELMRHRQVSKAAQVLGLSQPAVSNSLARLRIALGDPLFVRTAHGMTPTPYAQTLVAAVDETLQSLSEALSQTPSFDPLTSERNFRVVMTDIGEIYFLPDLLRTLARRAPHVRITTVRNTAVQLRDEMESGAIDLAIGLIPELQGDIFRRRLFKQRYVCMMRKAHVFARKGTLSKKDFEGAEHVAIIASGTGHGLVDQVLEKSGVKRDVRLTVPHFVAVGHILSATNLIATVPQALAERIAKPFELIALPHPVALPEFSIDMFWHARQQRDAANKWLRDAFAEVFAG
jgi:DNA-binding transcriptional LysR family regulator